MTYRRTDIRGEWVGVQSATAAAHADETLRVLVVSDVQLFQEGVSLALARQAGISVIGTTDATNARALAAEVRPDVVLLDVTRRDSIDQARALAASVPTTKVVAFGVPETSAEVLALAAAGTAGYVRADAEGKDVAALLGRVMHGELVCSPRAAASLYHQVAVLSHDDGFAGENALSKRELQIAHLIDRGLSNKEIARALSIEATTVKNHVHNIFDKLKVHRRSDAAARMRASSRAASTPGRAQDARKIS